MEILLENILVLINFTHNTNFKKYRPKIEVLETCGLSVLVSFQRTHP